jgi:XTP/dITP diphosphohydrolase
LSAAPTVVLATANAGKAREFGRLLGRALSVTPMPAWGTLPEETGSTFVENARLKAESVFAALAGAHAVLADDSGLEVTALGGRPGIMSARYAGESATDADNVDKLLGELAAHSDRSARFVCRLCLILRDGSAIEVEGASAGTITDAPRGADGFGYDPVFQPQGWTVTLAEARPEDKDRVSHRGAAARALLGELETRRLLVRGL